MKPTNKNLKIFEQWDLVSEAIGLGKVSDILSELPHDCKANDPDDSCICNQEE